MKKIIFLLLGIFVSLRAFAFDVEIVNMVGIPEGSTSTVALPSVIKADSDWIPLFRIDISTNETGYTLTAITFTLSNVLRFDATLDLKSVSSGVALFKDTLDSVWGNGSEQEIAITTTPSDWTGSSPEVIKVSPTSGINLAASKNSFYLCIKTSDQIQGDGGLTSDQFKVETDNAGEVVVEISDGSYTFTPTLSTAKTFTADTEAPAFQVAYTPDSSDGTSNTIFNQGADNVYKVGDAIIISFDLGEDDNSLNPGSFFALADLLSISSVSLLGTSGTATKTLAYSGGNKFLMSFTINSSTVNQNTDGVNPISFPIRIRDAAGNWSEWDNTFEVYLDSKAPSAATLSSPSDGAYVSNNSPDLKWSAPDEAHLQGYTLFVATSSDLLGDKNELTNIDKSTTAVLLPSNGAGNWDTYNFALQSGQQYWWGVVATDLAGLSSSASSILSKKGNFIYDGQAPSLTWNSPASGNPILRSRNVTIQGVLGDYDLSGVDTTTIVMQINDGSNDTVVAPNFTQTGSSWTITYTATLPDGSYTVKIDASDKLGNAMPQQTRNFRIDSTSPTVVDSDNDGESDYFEKDAGTNWLDSTDNSGNSHFWPLNNEKVNYETFVSAKQSKIYIAIDDPYNSGNYVSKVDSTQSTITVTGPKKSYTFGPGGYTIQVNSDDAAAGTYSKYDLVYVQLPVALAKDGSDDGTYTVEITPVDNAGNVGNKITRTFIYDTQGPTISSVTIPTSGDTASSVLMTIDVSDTSGVSGAVDAVKLYVLDSNFSQVVSKNNLTETQSGRYSVTFSPTTSGTYYYYFVARDYAGNVSTYPANADNNKAQAIKIVIEDKTGPWAVIGNETTKAGSPTSYIKTMLNVPTSGLDANGQYTDNTTPSVDDIPPVYSASNNILQATLEDEAVSATFYYRLSGSSTWNTLTTSETSSQIWEATWDTTGLQTGIYDIKIVAMDAYGNVSDPSSVGSSAWVQVELKDALPPEATIDTATNDVKISDGGDVNGTLVLCAKPATTGNLDFDSIRFEYQKAGTSSWVSISTDSDKTSSGLTTVKFYLDYADIPKINQTNSVSIDTSQITGVSLDFTSDIYDTVMTKTGDRWEAEVSFPPGTYDYKIKIEYADGTSVSVRDPNEQDNGGANSRINIAEFTAVWDVSSLSEGSYYVRAVARDSRGVEDTDAQYITVIVDRTLASISITQPNSSDNRLKTGTATTLYAEVNGDDASRVFFLYSDDGGATWQRITTEDTDGSDGWSQSWTPNASLSSDATYLLRACVLDRAGNLGTSSDLSVVLDATDPVIDEFSINGSSGTVDLNAGTQYSWKLASSDSDIDYLELSYSGSDSNITWSPGKTIYSQTGSFSGTLLITETDNVQRTITAKLYDKSGRTDTEQITVNVKDVTPSYPTITEVDGLRVRTGEKITTSNDRITVRCELDVTDGGVLKYQYKPSASSTWSTWQTNAAASPDTVLFPPQGVVLSDGDYDLRVLAIDNDNNSAISSVVTITVDSSQPVIKPASIISVDTNGNITAVEYDEEVDHVKFEYRKQGTSEWTYLNTDAAADATYGNAGKEWSVSLAGLPAETYEIRAISQISGVTEADVSITPVATVEIKEDSAGNKTYLLNPQTQIFASISNASFSSTYAGSENTFSATLQITSSQTLTDISARLLMDRATGSDVDKFLNVSGSTTIFTSSVDLSDLAQAGGSGVIVINATDSNGNILSVSKEFRIVQVAYQPDTPTGAGRVTNVDFTDDLENKSALAILPAEIPQTPSSQASLISPVGEPWEFILSEPEAFSESDPDGDGTLTQCTITMSYSDNELNGADENKIGVAYWDSSTGKWKAEGITNVTRDAVNNTVTFTVSHFSLFSLAIIDTEPEINLISPSDNGYAPSDPLIDIDISDGFSAIRSVKIKVDGVDQTANFTTAAGHDGIDNDGNGLVDEENLANFTTEAPLNQASSTGAKYKVKAPLHLTPGTKHSIEIIATNEQGISSTKTINFTVGKTLSLSNVYPEENPFNPLNENCRIYFSPTQEATIKIKIYDFAGKVIFEKDIGTPSQNYFDWNGRDENNNLLANGVYFVDIIAEGDSGKDKERVKIAILK